MKEKLTVKNIIQWAAMLIILVALTVGNVLANHWSGVITGALIGVDTSLGDSEEATAVLEAGDLLVQELQAEGTVLLHNDGTLPLKNSDKTINLLGWGSSDNGFSLSGTGSGSSSPSDDVTELEGAFTQAGWDVNMDLQDYYNAYAPARTISFGQASTMQLADPAITAYPDSLKLGAVNYSDTAVFVITRVAGENMGEVSNSSQNKKEGNDNTRSTLELSTQEEGVIEWMVENFENNMVLLNICNTMHVGPLEDLGVGAILYIGQTGQSGANAIPKILTGEINPSGRTAATYVYAPEYEPTYVNAIHTGNSIQYAEDIYLGYKWHETADEEGFYDDKEGYKGVKGYEGFVQYSFGHGLSYTTFEQEITSSNAGSLAIDGVIELEVTVTNTGDVAGKEVVQIYGTAPYTVGGIEKAHVNLLNFDKTVELPAGESQIIKFEIDAYDLASYDAYDKNENGFCGWELEKGNYEIKLMANAHEVIESVTYAVADDIQFELDPSTGVKVVNRWTGENAYAGVPIDGSTIGMGEYLSREDFEGTYPTVQHSVTNSAAVSAAAEYEYTGYDDADMPTTGVDNSYYLVTYEDGSPASQGDLDGTGITGDKLVFNETLIQKIGNDFDNEIWDSLVQQMSLAEYKDWVECSGFGNKGYASVGKASTIDLDGPSGFNTSITMPGGDEAVRTAFPSPSLNACTWSQFLLFSQGRSQGAEASLAGITGWYAPTVNLFRGSYNARNFEAYSEDGVLSGMLASELIRGASSNGLTCYLKHLALSEPGQNPKSYNMWITEQNLRENYLRAFEIPVKSGHTNAIMSAFNRIGCVWAGSNQPLLTEVLRGEWGFDGVVLTDWSNGDSEMNTPRGVLAGNDIWLNTNSTNGTPISTSSAKYMAAAQDAAKNVLYAYANSYYQYLNYDASEDDKYNATVGVIVKEAPFLWWVLLLVIIDIVIVLGIAFWALWTLGIVQKLLFKNKTSAPSEVASE